MDRAAHDGRGAGTGATGGPGLLGSGLCCRSFIAELQSFLRFLFDFKSKNLPRQESSHKRVRVGME